MSKITVVLTCFNEGLLLNRAVNSLENQTIQDFEIIIVKDFSENEETNTVCRDLEKRGYSVLRSETNIGVSGTRNIGIAKAQGDIVLPFDADDELPLNTIEIISKTFKDHPEADVIFGNYKLYDWETINVKDVDCSIIVRGDNSLDIRKYLSNSIIIGNSPFRKSVWKKVKGYSSEFSFSCQDIDFHQRLLLSGAKFYYINQTIYTWFRKKDGINSSLLNKEAVDKCNYNNICLFVNYCDNEKYVLNLFKSFKDMKAYKNYFYGKLKEKNKFFFSIIIRMLPNNSVTYFSRFL